MPVWVYSHQDLGEAPYPNGTPVVRPVVPLLFALGAAPLTGVFDSGSPASIADAGLFGRLGIDVDADDPLFEIHLGVGARFGTVPVFEVELWLSPPERDAEPVAWRLQLGARRGWRLPFAVLLGQRGWFDRFPTRIDSVASVVEV